MFMNTISKKKQSWLAVGLVLLLIIIDQWIKVYVKTHFALHEDYEVTSWFHLLFIENNGMAFGMEFGAKLFLTIFRIVASGAIVYYIAKRIKEGVKTGFLITLALILAGAVGNIFDCVFYGLIFDNPVQGVASFVPFGEGYGQFLEGRVVDMFYFPLFEWDWPTWMPYCGGDHFIFFSPIFNFADACISCGVIAILLFYGKTLVNKPVEEHVQDDATAESNSSTMSEVQVESDPQANIESEAESKS